MVTSAKQWNKYNLLLQGIGISVARVRRLCYTDAAMLNYSSVYIVYNHQKISVSDLQCLG